MLVALWRSVASLKTPKLLLIERDFSWISAWIVTNLPGTGAERRARPVGAEAGALKPVALGLRSAAGAHFSKSCCQ
eukprot:4336307-Prymnesium_polylepis.2